VHWQAELQDIALLVEFKAAFFGFQYPVLKATDFALVITCRFTLVIVCTKTNNRAAKTRNLMKYILLRLPM